MTHCKTPRAQLKCSHCNSTGKHNTSDYCNERQARLAKAEDGKDTAKANKVEGRDSSSTGDDKEEEGKANLVGAVEEEEDTDSNDEDDQKAFSFTLMAEEDHICSAENLSDQLQEYLSRWR